MEKFLFLDGADVCLYSDGNVARRQSKFVEKYKAAAFSSERASSWKYDGDGAMFRGDFRKRSTSDGIKLSGVSFGASENEAIYSYIAEATSGVYSLDLNDGVESHVVNSMDRRYVGGCSRGGRFATAVEVGGFCSDIAVFDLATGDCRVVTEGDTYDCDPFISEDNENVIYYSSRGAGRNSRGEFVTFGAASVLKLNLNEMTVEEVVSSKKYGYFKPVSYCGNLYALKVPAEEKGINPVVEILLMPLRILQAIAGFLNLFVKLFSGKNLVSGGGNGSTRTGDRDNRLDVVRGNLVNAEKESKKNARSDKHDYGFIPRSWQVVDLKSGKAIISGVADYDVLSDGTVIATNGRRIFAVKDGKIKKLCDAQSCLFVAAEHSVQCGEAEVFDVKF